MSGYDDKMGTYNNEKVFCPVNGWDCPYFHGGLCVMQGGDPMEDCDDFQMYFESWEEWESL